MKKLILLLSVTTSVLSATTNHISFGSTNTAPADPVNIDKWISVQINGEATAYRIPLYK